MSTKTLYLTNDPDTVDRLRQERRRVALLHEALNMNDKEANSIRTVRLASDIENDSKARERVEGVFQRANVSDVGSEAIFGETRLSRVQSERIDWLWPGYLARGIPTTVVGQPGRGKTMTILDLMARMSRGDSMPDGTPIENPIGSAIITFDDDVRRTIRPRLEAAGAELELVHAVDGFNLLGRRKTLRPSDIPDLLEHFDRSRSESDPSLGLIVIDPLSAFMRGKDQNNGTDVYDTLGDVRAYCEDRGVSLVLIAHTGKKLHSDAVNLAAGSTAIGGISRLMALVDARQARYGDEELEPTGTMLDELDPGDVVWLSAKTNLGPRPDGVIYRMTEIPTEIGPIGRAEAQGPIKASAQDWIDALSLERDPIRKSTEDKVAAFRDAILAAGVRWSEDVSALAEEFGISERTMKTYRKRMRAGSHRAEGCWLWVMPGETPDEALAIAKSAISDG